MILLAALMMLAQPQQEAAISTAPAPTDSKSGESSGAPGDSPVPAFESSRTDQLDAMLKASRYTELNALLSSASDETTFLADLDWLKQKSFAGHSAFIPLTYGSALWSATGSDPRPEFNRIRATALAMLIYTVVAIDMDGTRCQDRSAPGDRITKIIDTRREIFAFAHTMDAARKQQVADIVLGLDKLNTERRQEQFDAAFLCTGGLQHMMFGMENGTVKERPAKKDEIGRQMEITEGAKQYVPELIDKEKWLAIVAEKRAKLPETIDGFLGRKAK